MQFQWNTVGEKNNTQEHTLQMDSNKLTVSGKSA